ncbi:MAG: HAMP domain-containing sensor histidine kinase [Clostridium sp.]|uniref:HAMP domain-containing sensor histidine kinase n=1 Tax=Clostridium culturomicium TaxID=1499683 RepID=UPI00058DE846|nr:HAMP domain-containing sensor histidine kinase [Clostridium culturomicium]MDU4892151.1 HAMP domain-containing sensor histidine kinase [Clostridium sp.]MDU7082538.1 HAMP domain-containing sensor histidine kinase [Clostridium sp.]
MSSIRKKISSSYIIIITITVIIIQIILYGMIRSYYYKNLRESIEGQIKISSDFYNTYLSGDSLKENIFNNRDMFWSNTTCRVQVIDLEGRVIMDSSGYIDNKPVTTPEVTDALKKIPSTSSKIYTNTDFKDGTINAATSLYYDTSVGGVLRFSASTAPVEMVIRKFTYMILGFGALVIAIASTVSLFIANSLMKPLNLVCRGAEKMARGNFKEAIPKYSRDEVGKLAETLNFMSDEIQKNERLKNEFISSISHELRTPLTSIKGWAIILESSDLKDKDEVMEGLKIIEEEVGRLTYLVEELLDFSKLSSGKITLSKEMTNVEEFCLGILKQLEPRFESKVIDVNFNSNTSNKIELDRNRMKQVLINVLDNSIKFSPKKSRIKFDLSEDKEWIKLIIEDEGYGISRQDLPHVKEKFYKGRNVNSSNGIGLSICDEIIGLHGGRFEIESELGEGTKVTISLPRRN